MGSVRDIWGVLRLSMFSDNETEIKLIRQWEHERGLEEQKSPWEL